MEAVPSILTSIGTSDGFADSGSSDDEDRIDDSDALASPLSDVSKNRWPRQVQHGFPGSLGSWLGSSLNRLRSFWRPRKSRASSSSDFHHRHPDYPGRTEPSRMALVAKFLGAMMCSSWINMLLVFVPVGYASYFSKAHPTLTFLFNALAIVPLSALLTQATEKIARDAGETIGAILNISLGNLVELILLQVPIFAPSFLELLANITPVAAFQASILGSILVNLLLILGSALLACGLPDQEFTHYTAGTQLLGCLLFVSVFAFLMPTAFDYAFKDVDGAETASLKMSRISAVMVLLIYAVYFIHEVKYHAPRRGSAAGEEENRQAVPLSSQPLSPQALPLRTIRFADEGSVRENRPLRASVPTELDDLSAADEEANDEDGLMESHRRNGSNGTSRAYNSTLRAHRRARSLSLGSNGAIMSRGASMDGERTEFIRPYLTTRQMLRDSRIDAERTSLEPNGAPYGSQIDRLVSFLMLVVTSVLMSVSAEFLASTIDDVTHHGHLSESLIGLIIVPIVGNVAEYATVVTVAARDNMGLALAVSVGSSIQIALCVTPLTVIAGWVMDRGLVLAFNFFEMATLLGSVLLVNFLILGEGISGPLRSSGLKGGLMCACYVIIGVGAFLSP